MLKVNNKETRITKMASLQYFYCYLRAYLTSFSNASITAFEQANVYQVDGNMEL